MGEHAFLAATLSGALLAVACDPAQPASARRPNVLLIAVDTLRSDHLSGYGYARRTSPHLDAFLASAVVFEDAQSASSWTLASMASLFTGQHASTHRCADFERSLDSSFTTLTECLQAGGYQTTGLASHVFLHQKHGLTQGFGHYDQSLIPMDTASLHEQISSPALTDGALAWLAGRRPGSDAPPWFLFVHYFDPHSNYHAHAQDGADFGPEPLDRYDSEIAFTDGHIGRLLAGLESLGVDEHTLVVLVSDHGEEFGEHGAQHHGKTLHREVLQIPLALRAPALAPRRVTDTVRIVDVLPTVLELVGLPPPQQPIAGASLVALARGQNEPARAALAELRLKLDHPADALIFGRWKLVADHDPTHVGPGPQRLPTRLALYDRQQDPGELHDVADQHPELVKQLEQRLLLELQLARRLGEGHAHDAQVEHSSAELEALRALGYTR